MGIKLYQKIVIRFIENYWQLILILILSGILRFYKIEPTFYVLSETGADFLIARDAIIHHTIPLHGVVTSHTWLYFGPLYWWLLEIYLLIFKFNPIAHAILGRTVSILTVCAIYLFVQRVFSKRNALFATLLVAISPVFMNTARVGRHDSFTILFSALFLYILSFSDKKKLKWPFLLGLILGVGVNFEYTFLPMTAVFISYVFLRKLVINFKIIARIAFAFLLPFVPLAIYDFNSKSGMLLKIIAWIPYRVLGYFHIIKSTIEVPSFAVNSYSIWKLIPDNLLASYTGVSSVILIAVTIFGVILLLFNLTKKKFEVRELLLFLPIFWYLVSLLIHTNPPIHYFDEIFFMPIILICYLAEFYWNNLYIRSCFLILVIIVSVFNLQYYFSTNWFFKDYTKEQGSYLSQKNLVKKIVVDAKGQKFSLGRVGVFDNGKGNFADNYRYFLWYFGNAPVSNARIKYIIYEDRRQFLNAKAGHINFTYGNFGVIKIINK